MTKPVSLAQLRAAFAMYPGLIAFGRGCYGRTIAGKTTFFSARVIEGLEARKMCRIRRRQPHKGARAEIYGADLTALGKTLVRANPPMCIGCGCTDARACPEGCSWVAPGWCSACDELHAAGAGGLK